MAFNEAKCVLLKLHHKKKQITSTYSINQNIISEKKEYRDLGVIISGDLTWTSHYNKITSKAYRSLGLLRRTFSKVLAIATKRTLYLSLVRSHLMYCSQVWKPHLLGDIKLLENVQRRATKFILHDFTSNYKQRLMQLSLLPLMMEFELQDIMFFITQIKSPSSHFQLFNHISFNNNNSTRSSTFYKLSHSPSSDNLTRNHYFQRLPRLWNALPPVDLNQSLHTIKIKLKQTLRQHFHTHFNPDITCTFHFLCPCSKC